MATEGHAVECVEVEVSDMIYEETVELVVPGIGGGGVTMKTDTALKVIDALKEVIDRVAGMKERLERHPVLGDVGPAITIKIDGGQVSATMVVRTSWARHQRGMSP